MLDKPLKLIILVPIARKDKKGAEWVSKFVEALKQS